MYKRFKMPKAVIRSRKLKIKIEHHKPNRKPWSNSGLIGRIISSFPVCATRRVTIKRHEHHVTWKSCRTSVNANNILKKHELPKKRKKTNESKEEQQIA